MLVHLETMRSWIDLKDVKEINDFKQIQIITKLSEMTFRDLKCYRLPWKLTIVSKKSIFFSNLLKARGLQRKSNSNASIGMITLKGAFLYSGFKKILN